MKSLLYHGFGIKGYRYRRTRYEKGEIIFELEPEERPEVPQGQKLMRRGFRWRDVRTVAIGPPFHIGLAAARTLTIQAGKNNLRSPASTTNSRLTPTGRGGNFEPRAKQPESPANRLSVASSGVSGLRQAWASRATFASGRSCCGLVVRQRLRPILRLDRNQDKIS